MNENYGWLIIDTPEKKRHYGPIQKGDEYQALADGTWKKETYCIGRDFCTCHNGRRPLVIPDDPEWELVGLDEVPPEHCETFNRADAWEATTFFRETRTIREIIAAECPDIRAIRRKRQPQPASQWACPIAESVSGQLKVRAEKGFKKYGVNLTRTDLDTFDYLQHLQEELLDAAVYIERLKQEPPPLPQGEREMEKA